MRGARGTVCVNFMFSAKSTEFQNLKGSKTHAYEMHACEIHTCKIHACEIHAYEMHARKACIQRRASHERVSVISVSLISVYLIKRASHNSQVCISQSVYLKRTSLFTSLPCAQDTGGENPCIDTQDGFKASDYGRLGRQAAGHPWSALRVAKSCRKDCLTASVLPKPKQQLCIQSGTRAYYLNYLPERWARRGKEAQAIGLAIR
jgi:hypothetical protein